MSKTINEAMGDLIKGLGANPSVLADNSTISDYIEDLAGAIKGETASIIDDTATSSTKTYSSTKIASLIPADIATIDDTEASLTKTYSSSKIVSLIPAPELPAVTADNNGQVLAVVNGAWTLCTISASASLDTGAVTFTFTPVTPVAQE